MELQDNYASLHNKSHNDKTIIMIDRRNLVPEREKGQLVQETAIPGPNWEQKVGY